MILMTRIYPMKDNDVIIAFAVRDIRKAAAVAVLFNMPVCCSTYSNISYEMATSVRFCLSINNGIVPTVVVHGLRIRAQML